MSGAGVLRVAMWSGPRNISTAMMRSWGNRPDTFVCDEPLYAHYLSVTGREHPGAGEVIAAGQTDVKNVVNWLTGPVPLGRRVFYQKHMSHHLLPDVPRDWLRQVSNCFLIREPREVLTSLVKHVPDATLPDTGYAQQAEIFDLVRGWTGRPPPVVDARDVLNDPRRVLGLLCEALGLEFTDAMLSWPPGPRETDGLWAKYWYKEVETTTSFRPYRPKNEPVPAGMGEMLDQCEAYYQGLYTHRLV
jgi:sulfotransferase family protein